MNTITTETTQKQVWEILGVFILLIALEIAFIYLNSHFLISDEVAESAISGNYTQKHIEEWKMTHQLMVAPHYFRAPFAVIIPVLFFSFLMFALLKYKEDNVCFLSVLRIVQEAFFLFLIPAALTFFWFVFFQSQFTFVDLIRFDPTSVAGIVGKENLSDTEITILKRLNLSLLLFFGLVSWRLSKKYESISLAYHSMAVLGVLLLYQVMVLFWKLVL